MEPTSRLQRDAHAALSDGRFREALLLYRHAAGQAEMRGDRAAWFENLVWASTTAYQLDDIPLALRLLLEARVAEPPDRPDYAAVLARKNQFAIAYAYQPVLSRVLESLEQLREFAREFPAQQADIEYLASLIQFARGHILPAREGFERAWQLYTDSREGYWKESHASANIRCCLEMNDASSARQWLAALEDIVSDMDRRRKLESIMRHRLYLALLEGTSSEELRQLLRAFEDVADPSEEEAECLFIRVRANLLDPDGGDPAGRAHPARRALTRHRFPSRWTVYHRFDRRLLLLDYRLAALRYAGGIAPVDDRFYSKSQAVPARLTPVVAEADLTERIRRARIAANVALSFAQKLDSWLECDTRQKKVEARRARIEEIAMAWSE